ncbi:unnamed protein product [Effrenium voratum]|nr:unnamed protein product [Effrenium voratum]
MASFRQYTRALPERTDHVLSTLLCTIKTLRQQLYPAWIQYATRKCCTRKDFQLCAFDPYAAVAAMKRVSPREQSLIGTIMNGKFFTHEFQAKYKPTDISCPLCGEPDSKFHRIMRCPAVDHIRANHTSTIRAVKKWWELRDLSIEAASVLRRYFIRPDGVTCGLRSPLDLVVMTLLLSVGLKRLSLLCVDLPADSKMQDELQKSKIPPPEPRDVEVSEDLQAQAERELRAEILRERQNNRHRRVDTLGPWRPLARWLQAAERSVSENLVYYRLAVLGWNVSPLSPVGHDWADVLDPQVRFGPKDGRPGRREHHKFGASSRKGTYFYRFHKLVGKANWRKYLERYMAPRALENRQRWIPTPYATYTQGKHAHSWNWRLPKGLAAATTADEVLEVWLQFRHKHPKRTFHYFKVLKRLTDVGGCDRGDWRLRFIMPGPQFASHCGRELEPASTLAQEGLQDGQCLDAVIGQAGLAAAWQPAPSSVGATLALHRLAAELDQDNTQEEIEMAVYLSYAERASCPQALTWRRKFTTLQDASVIALQIAKYDLHMSYEPHCPCLDFGAYEVNTRMSVNARPALAQLCTACAKLKVHEIQLFEVVLAHVADHWYDYPATSLAEIGLALAPVMPAEDQVLDTYRKMFNQIRHDRSMLTLRGVAAAARFMAEVDHKEQFMPGLSQALAARLMALKSETKECYDVARVTEIFSKRCPEDHGLFSTLCRHVHRHLGYFEPVDFVRFTRGLAAAEYRDERVTLTLPKWAQKRHKEFSPHDWDAFVTSLARLGASEIRQRKLRELGPPAPTEPATFSGGQMAQERKLAELP